jgi:signal transduction histidine kinase
VSGEASRQIGQLVDDRRIRRLMEVGRSLVSQLDLEALLQEVLEVACELTGARYAALGILDDEGQGLERFLTRGIDEATFSEIGDLPFLGVPIRIRGDVFGNLYLTEKDTGPFDETDEETVSVLAEWAAIAIENARLYAGVQDRRRELERAVTGLEATTEVARAVGGETDLDRMLETIVKRARALVEARSLVILLEDHGELEVAATAGEFSHDVHGERLTIGRTTWGGILRGLRPERLPDVRTRLGISPPDLGVEATAALLVPLNFRGQALGVIAAFDRLADGPEFDSEDERLMLAFAASAATAVATAQSVAEERLRHSIDASEGERRRWARELHDETLQGLGALRVVLAAAARRGSPDEVKTAVDQAVGQLTDEIASLRALIAELRPAALDELGLVPAVESLLEHHATVSGWDINAEVSFDDGDEEIDAGRLEPELESTVYRVVQEALTNVSKHANADCLDLTLVRHDARLDLMVRDDGIGFDPSARHGGFGLLGMRERVELAGGELEITSRPGAGAEVKASVPIRRAPGHVVRERRSA